MEKDLIDRSGNRVHYSEEWERVSFTDGKYSAGRTFRLYVEAPISLAIKGVRMKRPKVIVVYLTEGYHNFVCDEIIEAGSDPVGDAVYALF